MEIAFSLTQFLRVHPDEESDGGVCVVFFVVDDLRGNLIGTVLQHFQDALLVVLHVGIGEFNY